MAKVVLLNSGGIDSAIVARHLFEQGDEVYSVFIDSGQLGVDEQKAAAQITADKYAVSHHTITIDFGMLPNHYMREDGYFQMFEGYDGLAHSPVYSGPPNQPFVLAALGGAYARMIGADTFYTGHRYSFDTSGAEHYNEVVAKRRSKRPNPILELPLGDDGSNNQSLTKYGYSRADFDWTVPSVPPEYQQPVHAPDEV